MIRGVLRNLFAPAVVLAAGACFATRSDVRVLQGDIAVLRAEAVRADSAHREQLRQLSRQVGVLADTLRGVDAILGRIHADFSTSLHAIGQQLITVQELTGQSQKRLQEMRADLEARAQEVAVPPPAAVPGAPGATPGVVPGAQPGAAAGAPAPVGTPAPGPNQLYQLAQAQLRRGSAAAARAGFQDLLAQYPASDLAADAQFGIGESYAAEGSTAADSAFALVAALYPASGRAPTALYKRATSLRLAGQAARARAIYQQIVDRYPRSDESVLSAEFLRTLK